MGKKIVVCVGNITKNKNQIQAVRCISHINNECLLVVLGNEADGGELRRYICEHKLHKNVVLTGFCDDLDEVWKSVDLNAFVSLNDGFGLSIIEGYLRCIPCVTFADLDAVPDLWNEETMLLAKSRSIEDLTEAIRDALIKKWNRDFIRKYATQFSLDRMVESYEKNYVQLLSGRVVDRNGV